VAIRKITVTIILFFVIGCRSFVFLLRNPKRNSKTANRQRIIVIIEKKCINWAKQRTTKFQKKFDT
ncbi:hypothetical protein ACFRCT_26655, partial [Bacillus mycoides]|uniref:hypothetical protein n=1 Tax=Bacillus mycoides TaxID=1405 RepID=UPI00366CB728